MLVSGLYMADYLQFFEVCVILITQLLRYMGRFGSDKPVQPHQLYDSSHSNQPFKVSVIGVLVASLCCILTFTF